MIASVMIAYAILTDRLSPRLVNDSPSYLEYPFDSLSAALRSIRTPGYPIFLQMTATTIGVAAVPLVQLLLHALAAWMLLRELLRWNALPIAAGAAAIAVAFGCTPLDNLAIVSTDSIAASIGVMVAVMLMRWRRRDCALAAAMPVIIFGVMCIAIRPAYLALIPWVAVAGSLLGVMPIPTRNSLSIRRAILASAGLSIAMLLPIVGWCVLRGVVVGDYAVLPFGHQNLAGITLQLVSDDEIRAISGEPGRLGREFLIRRDEVLRNDPSLSGGDASTTMTMEARWDPYIWLAIVPSANLIHSNDTIASHRGIAALNREIIWRYPVRYIRWLALAARRSIWGTAANILMNPVFLVAFTLVVLGALSRAVTGQPESRSTQDPGIDALFVVAVTYFIVGAGFIIFTSPPLGRFTDASAIFIPAWIAARAARRIAAWASVR